MNEPIRVKPHHVVDIITSFGTGRRRFEPHPYGHAVHSVAAAVAADPDVMLQMELGADDICAPCSHNIDGVCDDTIDTSYRPTAPSLKREWNLRLDRRWCTALGLREGDRLTARRFCELLRDGPQDLTDIYREIPADRTADRAANLQKGVAAFLTGQVRLEA
ncbi:MAG: hypothetical protein GXY85_05590 [Candidatus Brocadiaceae bacterium]|nr:hypothetical protein [Candidatus Brocadiaceae bacterium]